MMPKNQPRNRTYAPHGEHDARMSIETNPAYADLLRKAHTGHPLTDTERLALDALREVQRLEREVEDMFTVDVGSFMHQALYADSMGT